MLEPRGPQLARPPFEAVDQPTRLLALVRERLDPTDLVRDLGERARRIRIELGQPPFGGAELRVGGARPAVRLVAERPQLALGRRLSADDLAEPRGQLEIEFLGRTNHLGGAETARSATTAPRLYRRRLTFAWRTRVFGRTGPTSSMFFDSW